MIVETEAIFADALLVVTIVGPEVVVAVPFANAAQDE